MAGSKVPAIFLTRKIKDMNNIVEITKDEINSVEQIDEINFNTDIVISLPEDKNFITFDLDGSINILADREYNLTLAKQLTGFIPIIRKTVFTIPMKICIPNGYFISTLPAKNSEWIMSMCPKYNSFGGYIFDEELMIGNQSLNIISKSPNYMMYNRFNLSITFNSDLLKLEIPSMIIKDTDILCRLMICKNYLNNFASGNIYYIKNNEVYQKLVDESRHS